MRADVASGQPERRVEVLGCELEDRGPCALRRRSAHQAQVSFQLRVVREIVAVHGGGSLVWLGRSGQSLKMDRYVAPVSVVKSVCTDPGAATYASPARIV